MAKLIEDLVAESDAFVVARRDALAELERGYDLGGRITATRDEWHER